MIWVSILAVVVVDIIGARNIREQKRFVARMEAEVKEAQANEKQAEETERRAEATEARAETLMHNARAKLEQATREIIAKSAHEPGTFVIHEPAAGCMRGWKRVATAFVARDHHSSPACVRGFGQPFEMDYLMPGESFNAAVLIPLNQAPRPATGDNSD